MRLYWLDYFILTTYSAQIIQICFYSVPSAGSTVEMLLKVRKKPASATNHPASTAIKSTSKIIFMLAATLVVFRYLPLRSQSNYLGVGGNLCGLRVRTPICCHAHWFWCLLVEFKLSSKNGRSIPGKNIRR